MGGVRRIVLVMAVVVVVLGVFVGGVGVAFAAGGGVWGLDAVAAPSSFSPVQDAGCVAGHSGYLEASVFCDVYTVTATNIGSQESSAAAVTLSDRLPAGLSVVFWSLHVSEVKELGGLSEGEELPASDCGVVGGVISCSVGGHRLAADGTLQLLVFVTVNETEPVARSLASVVSVEGGGGVRVQKEFTNMLVGVAPVFGFAGFTAPFLGAEGAAESQAGGHPYELPVKIDLSSVVRDTPEGGFRATSVKDLRDAVVDLPLGVSGSAVSAPACTLHQLSAVAGKEFSSCPADTIVGYLHTLPEGLISASSPIYNLVPERGVAAEFGFLDTIGDTHVIDASIAPTPEGYVLRSTAREVPQVLLDEVTTNIYGDPAARDKSHAPAVAMFTNPAVCTGKPLVTSIYIDSWQTPGAYNPDGTPAVEDPAGGWVKEQAVSPPVTGCEALAGLFSPSLEAQQESSQADTPTGLQVNIGVPQQEGAEAPATPPVKEIEVRLPEGLTVNPSSANGLDACSEAQIGWQGKTPAAAGELEDFNEMPPEASAQEEAEARAGVAGEPARCPKASRIGSVEVESPALPAEACKGEARSLTECASEEPAGSGVFPEREKTPLQGAVYLASENENPFGSLIAAYFVINDPRTGVIVKLPGKVELNEATGQLTTIVKDSPQFPFSQLRTHIYGGASASLSTPSTCGSYTLSSLLTPWSHEPGPGETTGTPDAEPSAPLDITSGVGASACPTGSLAFAPVFAAGVTGSQAAAFTTLNASIARQDGEGTLAGVTVTTPPGLAAIIKSVRECPEPQASEGNCPPESLIGEANTAVGAGPDPYWVHAGKVYLTGPYNNGPFGLSIVVPTTAGPFTLTGLHGGYGKEVVRASIRINPVTAQASVVSDPLPRIIQGIPLQIRAIDISINRPGFMFNPTNCETLQTTATLTSSQGTTVTPTSPFHTANCSKLPFKPTLTATASAQGSKRDGTSFTVKISSPGLGQANIHKVDLTIPSVLPSRLETIQKACLAQTFDANPASCDEGSIIGEGIAYTPVLQTPLRGPAYLVSNAAAAFPDVEFVLQSEGVKITLDGKTDIKNKVTYSKFETAPDAPFTLFEAILPAGPHSAFTTNVPENEFYNLCHQPRITLPTQITAQNNAQINQTTTVQLQGCPTKIKITSHKTNNHNHTLTLTIYIPTAGKLKITGNGITPTTHTTTTRETTTIKIHIKTHHPHTTQLHLTYTPTTNSHTQTTHTKTTL